MRGARACPVRASCCAVRWRPVPSTAPRRSRRSCPRRWRRVMTGDAEILNFALTLEYLESDFYNVKGKQVGLSGPGQELRDAVRRRGEPARRSADRRDQAARRQADRETDVRVPGHQRKDVPRARLGAREHRRRRLQRRGAVAEEQAGAGRGRRDRADRGAPRGRRRPADRQEPDSQRWRSTCR